MSRQGCCCSAFLAFTLALLCWPLASPLYQPSISLRISLMACQRCASTHEHVSRPTACMGQASAKSYGNIAQKKKRNRSGIWGAKRALLVCCASSALGQPTTNGVPCCKHAMVWTGPGSTVDALALTTNRGGHPLLRLACWALPQGILTGQH